MITSRIKKLNVVDKRKKILEAERCLNCLSVGWAGFTNRLGRLKLRTSTSKGLEIQILSFNSIKNLTSLNPT